MRFISKWKARRAARKNPTSTKLTSSQQSAYEGIVATAQQKSAAPSQATEVTKIATTPTSTTISSGGGGTSTAVITSTPTSSTTTTTTTIVNKRGGVTENGITYHGKSVVPSTGLSSNQMHAAALIEAKKQYGSDVKRGTFSTTYTTRVTDRKTEVKAIRGEIKTTTPEQALRRQGVTEPETPLADSIRDIPFYNKTIGEAFAKEGFQRPSKKIVKVKEKVVDLFSRASQVPSASDLLFKKSQRGTVRDIKGKATAIAVGGGLILVPETPGQLITTAGVTAATIAAPPIVGSVVGAGFGLAGGRVALDPTLTPEQRVAGGLVAVSGATGTYFAAKPFVKSGFKVVTGKARLVVSDTLTAGKVTQKISAIDIQRQNFQEAFIVKSRPKFLQQRVQSPTIKSPGSIIDFLGGKKPGQFRKFTQNPLAGEQINIIPQGKGGKPLPGAAPGEGAPIRGGFGFKPSEQIAAFEGQKVRATSAQADFKPTGDTFVSDLKISPEGTFFSGSDPVTKIPQVRVSRIGLREPFKFPDLKNAEFGTGGGTPRILVTEPTTATGGTPKPGQLKIAPKKTTEFELTTKENLQIVGEPGTAIIKGQPVDILTVKLAGNKPLTPRGGSPRVGDIISSTTPTKTTIDVPSSLPSSAIIKGNIDVPSSLPSSAIIKGKFDSNKIVTSKKIEAVIEPPVKTTTKVVTSVKTTVGRVGRGGAGGTSVSVSVPKSPPISDIVSKPIAPSISPPRSTRVSPPLSPSISTIVSPPISPPLIPRITTRLPKRRPPARFPKQRKTIPKQRGFFGVQVRRGGIFKSVGAGLSLKEAQSLGRQRVAGTLAATYKITGKPPKALRTPKGFYSKADKEGVLFIEKRGKRLSKKTETQEIQIAKRKKKVVKRKSTKKKKK